jgi:hypothetical protein
VRATFTHLLLLLHDTKEDTIQLLLLLLLLLGCCASSRLESRERKSGPCVVAYFLVVEDTRMMVLQPAIELNSSSACSGLRSQNSQRWRRRPQSSLNRILDE